jgi:hypothetical protein
MTDQRENDLHNVHQGLKDLIDSLRQQRERWQVPRAGEPSTPQPPGERAPARSSPPARATPRTTELSTAEERLQEKVRGLELENQRLYDESVALAEHTTHLANLYVALERLHGSLVHEEVLTALEEIITSMVGSEDFALLERQAAGPGLRVARAHGAAAQKLGTVTLGAGVVGGLAATGKPYLGGHGAGGAAAELVACIPLMVGGEVTGAIAIFELLAHKPQLTPADAELLRVLSTHAASALHLTSARTAPEPG